MGHDKLEAEDFELASRLNTAYRRIKIVGKSVFVPPIYSSRRRPYEFNIHELRFLHHLCETNNFEKACELTPMGIVRAKKFLRSKDYTQFAAEALHDQAIQDGWTPRRVVIEIDRIYQGEKTVTDSQLEALKMMKSIIVPKSEAGSTLNIQQNVFNLPKLSPEVEAEFKELADKALQAEEAA